MSPRAAGVLLHPSSLANRYPIGDLGPAATAFADFLAEAGQRWWQMLPIGPAGGENSPYQSMSAFGGNPLLISPDRLVEQGLLERQDLELSTCESTGKVNFSAAMRLKLPLLKKAFYHFDRTGQGGGRPAFEAFTHAESYWLEDFSLFSAIQEKEGTPNWTRWSQELRTRVPDAMTRSRKDLAGEIRYHQFVQWQFSVQWKELRAYCTSKRVRLIGDVPLFVGHQSADVWAHPELFKLDAGGAAKVSAGVPPDSFSQTGQVWGVPVYRWEVLKAQDYRWWIERLRIALRRFEVNRLDHFIGFVRTYEVPANARTAAHGQYRTGGGASLFHAVRESLGALPFIADDLGATTPEVVALLDQLKIPGTRVLQFEFSASLDGSPVLPKLHPDTAIVYTGTHDNDTTAGWYGKLPSVQRDALRKRLGATAQEVIWSLIREALASSADTAIIPAQDLLELGSEARMNVPGVAEGNWAWRLKHGALTPALAQRLRSLTEHCERPSRIDQPTPTANLMRVTPYSEAGPVDAS